MITLSFDLELYQGKTLVKHQGEVIGLFPTLLQASMYLQDLYKPVSYSYQGTEMVLELKKGVHHAKLILIK